MSSRSALDHGDPGVIADPQPLRRYTDVIHALRHESIDGERFARCACGLVMSDAHGILPVTCPIGEIDTDTAEQVARIQREAEAKRARLIGLYRGDVQRYRLACAGERR